MSPRRADASLSASVSVAPKTAAPEVVRKIHEVRTPEGLVLPFHVATSGERLGAFLIDLVVLVGAAIFILSLLGLAMSVGGASGWTVAIALLALFVVFNGYFLFFELRPGAATPGKRTVGLRVMDVQGGVLSPDAVVARNLMRNLELTLPMAFVLAPESALGAGMPWWGRLLSVLWVFVVAGLPLFNRLRLRAGDLVGGTIVVRAPRTVLLQDLTARGPAAAPLAAPRHAFTERQLGVYGIYELQVLEDVLRQEDATVDARRTEHAVAERIARKIGWDAPVERASARAFLLDYYAALRAHLERKVLFGKRKRDKWSRDA